MLLCMLGMVIGGTLLQRIFFLFSFSFVKIAAHNELNQPIYSDTPLSLMPQSIVLFSGKVHWEYGL